jgi:hypothetical protein
MTFVGYPQCLGMKFVERVNEAPKLGRLVLGAELESLNGAPNDLPGGDAECARFCVE